jgi:hypothetical protein
MGQREQTNKQVNKLNYVRTIYTRVEVFTAVTMKKAIFWDVAPCRNGVNRRFGGTYRLHLHPENMNREGVFISASHGSLSSVP